MIRDFLSVVDPLSSSFATLHRLSERLLTVGRSFSSDWGQVSNSHQVVSGGSELEDLTDQPQSAVSGFAQQTHRLQPAEDFFHSFALSLTNFIPRMASGPLVDCASSSLVVLGHVWRYLAGAQISDKVFRVVTFVTAHGDPFLLRPLCQHGQRRFVAGSRRISKRLREFDELANVRWPLSHMKSAARYLQKDPEDIKATGGTNWQKYLPPRFQKIIFYPELWSEKEKQEWGKAGLNFGQ